MKLLRPNAIATFLAATMISTGAKADVSDLIITEVQVANVDQTLDFANCYGGWIELYNPTETTISLTSIYISDDPAVYSKFSLRNNGSIRGKSYACIYFDNNSSQGQFGASANKQVTFKLGTDGGTIYLSTTSNKEPFLTFTYPAAVTRCSYARYALDSDRWGYNAEPTPGAPNSNKFATTRLAAPVIDVDSHMFNDPFDFTVKIPSGATLRYTTDGSSPTLARGETSTSGKFHVDHNIVYRFCLFQDGYLPSVVVTRSYLKRDRDYYFPVLSVVSDPKHFYDDLIGVMVDGTNGVSGRGKDYKSNLNMDWERPVNFELITPDNEMAINQEANFVIAGGWSRHSNPTSFKIKAKKIYEGNNTLDYSFFGHKPYNKYKQIIVRNGGNDGGSRSRDAIIQQIVTTSGFYVDNQDFQPAHVFINGNYYATLNIREPSNRMHGSANYGYDDDEMDAFEYATAFYMKNGTRKRLDDWVKAAQNCSTDAGYEELCRHVDIDEFINYMASICYIGSTDWLGSNNNSKGYCDWTEGKWHMVMLDQDFSWESSNNVQKINNSTMNDVLKAYTYSRRNDKFNRQFVNAYCLLNGSIFTNDRCVEIGDSVCRLLEPALKFDNKNPWNSYNSQKGNMLGESHRTSRMNALKSAYGLGDPINVMLETNIPQANLLLDKQQIPLNKFNGLLYPPATITAVAPRGYQFVGWQKSEPMTKKILSKGTSWAYWQEGALDAEDWTGIYYTDTSWKRGNAPLGFHTEGKMSFNTTLDFGGDASNKKPTYYFRRSLNLASEPNAMDVFTVNFSSDDGFVMYVNGKEVYRYLMPGGDIKYSTYATAFAPGNPDVGTFTIPYDAFAKGRNMIAVEVHNCSKTSTDVYWDCEIIQSNEGSGNFVSTDPTLKLQAGNAGKYVATFEAKEDFLAEMAPVLINELSAGNDIYCNEYFKRDDWVELYNATNEDIDLAGMYLTDDPAKPHKFRIPAYENISTIIPANGYKIIWCSKRDPISQLHASFKLGNTDGSIVMLTAADDSWSDTMRYDAHSAKQTYGRYPDGSEAVFVMTHPTIANANQLQTADFELSDLILQYDYSGIEDVKAPNQYEDPDAEPVYYNLQGMRVDHPAAGIYIERRGNTSRKVLLP